ncbi:hypothetical protein SL1157_0881 [Ruegeria lacuscaerulensis ITI-1157]|nr:hypothetical protein SL1157_0881 [Ruegeria lacuscaerulensis ITI-1157]
MVLRNAGEWLGADYRRARTVRAAPKNRSRRRARSCRLGDRA